MSGPAPHLSGRTRDQSNTTSASQLDHASGRNHLGSSGDVVEMRRRLALLLGVCSSLTVVLVVSPPASAVDPAAPCAFAQRLIDDASPSSALALIERLSGPLGPGGKSIEPGLRPVDDDFCPPDCARCNGVDDDLVSAARTAVAAGSELARRGPSPATPTHNGLTSLR